MPTSGSSYERYAASVAARRDCQDARDALGGYVEPNHPDHANNSSPQRRQAMLAADEALKAATTAMNVALAAHNADPDTYSAIR